jgi:hypothetical protein
MATLEDIDAKLNLILAALNPPRIEPAEQHPAGSFLARCADADARRKQKLERRKAA